MLGAVLDRVVDVTLDEVVAVPLDAAEDEAVETTRCDFVLALPSRRLDRLLEQVDALLEVAASLDARDGHPRMTRDRLVAETLTELERTPGVLERCLEVTAAQSLESLRVEDVRMPAPFREASCELRRAEHRLVRFTVVPTAPEIVGELGEGARLLERCALGLPAQDRLPDHLNRLGLVVGEVTRSGTAFEEVGAIPGERSSPKRSARAYCAAASR